MPPVEVESLSESSLPLDQAVIYRVDVLPLSDDHVEKVRVSGLGEIFRYPVYWFRSASAIPDEIQRIAQILLTDPILQRPVLSTVESFEASCLNWAEHEGQWVLQQQFLPGVTDNLGKTVEKSLGLIFPHQTLPNIQVASGQMYLVPKTHLSKAELIQAAAYQLYNPLVQKLSAISVLNEPGAGVYFAFPLVEGHVQQRVETIPLDISEDALVTLSQQRNLALTLDEMKVIKGYFENPKIRQQREALGLPQWPTDIELEIFAQTWSEHCKHKIFSAQIEYTDASNPNYPETITIDGLFKTYIADSAEKLKEKRPDLLSVFKDNAGVLQWNDTSAICFKVETHNSPSALEPYGGALTGIVGVNRDILGTGLGAKPIFNTDVFCFAHPDEPYAKRPTMLPPESILQGVRKGVEDGGNKSGIPTINGALVFESRYRAKPLVFCGTGGLMPLKVGVRLGYEKYTQPGDAIVMAGGRVGKDGIHGATFSSEALNQDSPVSAVQIGDPITQKRLLDFMLEARNRGLITGVTDNGAGGLSSSVGEMAQITHGAAIHLEKIPLKYAGLAPYEIVISESQERMTFSTNNFEVLKALADQFDVEISNIGEFHTRGTFDILQDGKLLASLDLDFLHDGLPKMKLRARWEVHKVHHPVCFSPCKDVTPVLLKLLGSPNICSREALIRQYDHEVQGQSVIKPLMGEFQTAPCDAGVIQPVLGQPEGLVVSNGICPQFSDWDPYHMAACAIDEAVRNAVAVGADPKTIALLDNFCWPDPLPSSRNPDAEYKLAQLVRANQALYDMALAYETPFISGKDSMKNDFDDGEFRLSIPPTLLISAIGKIPDAAKAVSMEFKTPGDQIFLLGRTHVHLGGSQYYRQMGWFSRYAPKVHSKSAKYLYDTLFTSIQQGWIRSCHDLSEGGLAVGLAECALGGRYGASVDIETVRDDSPELRWDEALFSESPSRFIISVSPDHVEDVKKVFEEQPLHYLGEVLPQPELKLVLEHQVLIQTDVETLRDAWRRAPAKCYESGMTP